MTASLTSGIVGPDMRATHRTASLSVKHSRFLACLERVNKRHCGCDEKAKGRPTKAASWLYCGAHRLPPKIEPSCSNRYSRQHYRCHHQPLHHASAAIGGMFALIMFTMYTHGVSPWAFLTREDRHQISGAGSPLIKGPSIRRFVFFYIRRRNQWWH